MSVLHDLVSAHKFLCQAFAASQGADSSLPEFDKPAMPAKKPQHAQSPYLSEEEERQLQEAFAPVNDPKLEEATMAQFEAMRAMMEQRAATAPAPIPRQARPQVIRPEFGLEQLGQQPKAPPPLPVEEDEVPPEIAMMDREVGERMRAPERPSRRANGIDPNAIFDEFGQYAGQ